MKMKIIALRSVVYSLFLSALLFLFNAGNASAQWAISNYTDAKLPSGTIKTIIKNFMLWGLMLLGLFAIIGFAISGIMYLTAAGDDEQQKKAKKAMTYSITGVIVGLIGYIILQAVTTWLKGEGADF